MIYGNRNWVEAIRGWFEMIQRNVFLDVFEFRFEFFTLLASRLSEIQKNLQRIFDVTRVQSWFLIKLLEEIVWMFTFTNLTNSINASSLRLWIDFILVSILSLFLCSRLVRAIGSELNQNRLQLSDTIQIYHTLSINAVGRSTCYARCNKQIKPDLQIQTPSMTFPATDLMFRFLNFQYRQSIKRSAGDVN